MSTVEEIEAAILKLSPAEVDALRTWLDDFLEDQLELRDEVKTKLQESREEIRDGKFTTQPPEHPDGLCLGAFEIGQPGDGK